MKEFFRTEEEDPVTVDRATRLILSLLQASFGFREYPPAVYQHLIEVIECLQATQEIQDSTRELVKEGWRKVKPSILKRFLEVAGVEVTREELFEQAGFYVKKKKFAELYELAESFGLEGPEINWADIIKKLLRD